MVTGSWASSANDLRCSNRDYSAFNIVDGDCGLIVNKVCTSDGDLLAALHSTIARCDVSNGRSLSSVITNRVKVDRGSTNCQFGSARKGSVSVFDCLSANKLDLAETT